MPFPAPVRVRPVLTIATAIIGSAVFLLCAPAQAQSANKCSYSSRANSFPNPTIIHFDTGKTTIARDEARKIADTAKAAKDNFILQVCVRGFADKQGNAAANQKLSRARADAVAAELRKNGVDPRTIVIEAAGEPGGSVGSGIGGLANQADRRVEIRVTK